MKAKRRAQTQSEQRAASARVKRNLQTDLRFRSAKRIGSYLPIGGEIDVGSLNLRSDQSLFYPVLRERVRPWQGKGLLFGSAKSRLRGNQFGIPEPEHSPFLKPVELDCLLVPLLGFDRHGNRIGMGGGYYDRALQARRRFHSLVLIGVAYHWQEVSSIHPGVWDVPLDAIATDKELISINH